MLKNILPQKKVAPGSSIDIELGGSDERDSQILDNSLSYNVRRDSGNLQSCDSFNGLRGGLGADLKLLQQQGVGVQLRSRSLSVVSKDLRGDRNDRNDRNDKNDKTHLWNSQRPDRTDRNDDRSDRCSDSRNSFRNGSKSDLKIGPRSDPRNDLRTDSRNDLRTDSRLDLRNESKPEHRHESRSDSRSESRSSMHLPKSFIFNPDPSRMNGDIGTSILHTLMDREFGRLYNTFLQFTPVELKCVIVQTEFEEFRRSDFNFISW